jgi:competence/damage-inducible protein CinA-like protein
MPTAEIITIGTELLLGEIQDTNTHYIANVLRHAGIDLYRTTIIGDNEDRIAEVVQEAIYRSNIVLTTGGLGPTVDDPTRSAIAKALGVAIEFQPTLWEQIKERFQKYGRTPSENNRRQAYIPQGTQPIENVVGTAPAFIAETGNGVLISLPGVPPEMEYLIEHAILPFLKDRFKLEGTIKAFIIHTAGVGESEIDELLADLETLSNPTVGLVAIPGQIDIRVTAKAPTEQLADTMIEKMVNIIKERLDTIIFGYNETTLSQVVLEKLRELNKPISLFESGLNGELGSILTANDSLTNYVSRDDVPISAEELELIVNKMYKEGSPDLTVGISLIKNTGSSILHLIFLDHGEKYKTTLSRGGHEKLVQPWAVNNVLNTIRKWLTK